MTRIYGPDDDVNVVKEQSRWLVEPTIGDRQNLAIEINKKKWQMETEHEKNKNPYFSKIQRWLEFISIEVQANGLSWYNDNVYQPIVSASKMNDREREYYNKSGPLLINVVPVVSRETPEKLTTISNSTPNVASSWNESTNPERIIMLKRVNILNARLANFLFKSLPPAVQIALNEGPKEIKTEPSLKIKLSERKSKKIIREVGNVIDSPTNEPVAHWPEESKTLHAKKDWLSKLEEELDFE